MKEILLPFPFFFFFIRWSERQKRNLKRKGSCAVRETVVLPLSRGTCFLPRSKSTRSSLPGKPDARKDDVNRYNSGLDGREMILYDAVFLIVVSRSSRPSLSSTNKISGREKKWRNEILDSRLHGYLSDAEAVRVPCMRINPL